MYAAAGGASLASRQARQRQRQQNKKNNALLQQQRLAAAKAPGIITPTRVQQSRQFHQLPSSYLRTPQAQARKLSASYATQSKLLLPICEANNQLSHHEQQHHHQYEPYTRPVSPKQFTQQAKHQYLTKSATATFPLVAHIDATPPTSPHNANKLMPTHISEINANQGLQLQIPVQPHDSIIVTPATPLPSPVPFHESNQTPTGGNLERKCSFYRMKKTESAEPDSPFQANYKPILNSSNAQQLESSFADDDNLYGLPNGGGQKWIDTSYCEQGICPCDHVECAQGKAAWLERGRRCSVQDNNAASCHRRWVKRNRVFIQESSLGGSSDDEDLLGVLRGPSSFANAFLYVGLGTIAIGLVIAFVGTGEKGFKTTELRLIGPSLIGIGLVCCILRICFCICPSHCLSTVRHNRKKKGCKIDADHTTSLLRGDNKRISIARGTQSQKFPLTHKVRSNNKMMNEGMEALRQIATTSLFLQNEQKTVKNRVVPIINEPEKPEAVKGTENEGSVLNVCDVSDDDEDDNEACINYGNQTELLVQSQSKLARQRVSMNQLKKTESDYHSMQPSLYSPNSTHSQQPLDGTKVMPSTSKDLNATNERNEENIEPNKTLFLSHQTTKSHAVLSEGSSNSLVSCTYEMEQEKQSTSDIESKPITVQLSASEMTGVSVPQISALSASCLPLSVHHHSAPPIEPELVLSPANLGQ